MGLNIVRKLFKCVKLQGNLRVNYCKRENFASVSFSPNSPNSTRCRKFWENLRQ